MSSMEELLMGLEEGGGQGRSQLRRVNALFGGEEGTAGARLLVAEVALQQQPLAAGGRQRTVLSAVKNAPFTVKVALCPAAAGGVRSLQQLALEVVLFYDGEEEGNYKAVDFVKEKPLQWKETKAASSPLLASLQVRLTVLTSHHEGSLFRVGVVALDRDTGFPAEPPLRAFSAPIKVISKVEPHVKRNVTRKRMLNDMLVELVTKIDRQQEANDCLLRDYFAARRGLAPSPAPAPAQATAQTLGAGESVRGAAPVATAPQQPRLLQMSAATATATATATETPAAEPQQATESDPWAALQSQFAVGPTAGAALRSTGGGGEGSASGGVGGGGRVGGGGGGGGGAHVAGSGVGGVTGARGFERAFERFVAAYGALPQEEKAAKLRRLLRSAQQRQRTSVAALVQCLALERDRVAGQAGGPSCACRVCPYQKELSRIDDFYKDFLGNQEEFAAI